MCTKIMIHKNFVSFITC